MSSDVKKLNERLKELTNKHNNLVTQVEGMNQALRQIVKLATAQLGSFEGRQQAAINEFDRTMTGLDRNVLALAEMMKEVFGQLEQTDFFFARLSEKVAGANLLLLSPEDQILLKAQALEHYKDVTAAAFERVRVRLVDEAKEHAAKAESEQRAKEAAEKLAADAEEAERVRLACEQAEKVDRSGVTESGGAGATIPDGADIFGGD